MAAIWAAVGQDDQHLLAIGKGPVYQCGKGPHTRSRKDGLGLAVRAGAFAVGGHPGQIVRVVLHLNEIAALKAAKTHLLQPVYFYNFAPGNSTSAVCRVRQSGVIYTVLGEMSALHSTARPAGRQRDIPLPLIALFGVVFGQAVTQ